MALECFFFWSLLWVWFEAYSTRFLAHLLSLLLLWILLYIGVLLVLSLDLLGLFIASVYSSVFIALALLALQFGPFWSLSTSTEAASMRSSVSRMFIPMTLMVVVGCVGFSNQVVGYADWESFLLWQDLVSIDDSSLFSQCWLLHLFFYRCFVLETIGLNAYLFLALVGVTLLLLLKASLGASLTNPLLPSNQRSQFSCAGSLVRARLTFKWHRQARRANASRIRFKL